MRSHEFNSQINRTSNKFLRRLAFRFTVCADIRMSAEVYQRRPQSVTADIEPENASLTAKQPPAVLR
jgi:hypothetical protein